jgi:hypothetical protein
MRRYVGLAAALAAVALTPGTAEARRPRTGAVMTPFGPLYDTGSPEFRQSGGNPFLMQQLMQQKAMQQQQQMMLKQQQQMLKMQKTQGNGLNGPAGTNAGAANPFTTAPRRKKKRRTYDPTHPVTSPAPTTTAKPATTPATGARATTTGKP